jgi:hypothetical protein
MRVEAILSSQEAGSTRDVLDPALYIGVTRRGQRLAVSQAWAVALDPNGIAPQQSSLFALAPQCSLWRERVAEIVFVPAR